MNYNNIESIREKNAEIVSKLETVLANEDGKLSRSNRTKIDKYAEYFEKNVKKMQDNYKKLASGDSSKEVIDSIESGYSTLKKPIEFLDRFTVDVTEPRKDVIDKFLVAVEGHLRIDEIEETINKFDTFEELQEFINSESFLPCSADDIMSIFTNEISEFKDTFKKERNTIDKLNNISERLELMYNGKNFAPKEKEEIQKIDVKYPTSDDPYIILGINRLSNEEEIRAAYNDLITYYAEVLSHPEKYNNSNYVSNIVKDKIRPAYKKAMDNLTNEKTSTENVAASEKVEVTEKTELQEFKPDTLSDSVLLEDEETELIVYDEKAAIMSEEINDAGKELIPFTGSEMILPTPSEEKELIPFTGSEMILPTPIEEKELIPFTGEEMIVSTPNEAIIIPDLTEELPALEAMEEEYEELEEIEDYNFKNLGKDLKKWKKVMLFTGGAFIAGAANISTSNASKPIVELIAYAGLGSGVLGKLIKKAKNNKVQEVDEATEEQIQQAKKVSDKVKDYLGSEEFLDDVLVFSSGMLLGSKITSLSSAILDAGSINPDVNVPVDTMTPEAPFVENVSPEMPGNGNVLPDTNVVPDMPEISDVPEYSVTPDVPEYNVTPDVGADVPLFENIVPEVEAVDYSDIVVGDSTMNSEIVNGYTNSVDAINGADSLQLNSDIINDGNSIYDRFVIVDDAGAIVETINTDGVSVQDLVDKGYNPDNIAVDIRNVEGDPRAWVSLDEIGKVR
ncbi:MAG: hypothetical protein R3Y13_01600 [bacterium]